MQHCCVIVVLVKRGASDTLSYGETKVGTPVQRRRASFTMPSPTIDDSNSCVQWRGESMCMMQRCACARR
jgi:hypothetical protein